MIEAMKQALEALGKCRYRSLADEIVDPAITALRTAIAEAEKQAPTGKQSLQVEQEPVAEVKLKTTGGNVGIATVIHEIYSHYREPLRPGDKLYTTPPAAQRTWVGLTDADKREFAAAQYSWDELCSAVEAKLKESNHG